MTTQSPRQSPRGVSFTPLAWETRLRLFLVSQFQLFSLLLVLEQRASANARLKWTETNHDEWEICTSACYKVITRSRTHNYSGHSNQSGQAGHQSKLEFFFANRYLVQKYDGKTVPTRISRCLASVIRTLYRWSNLFHFFSTQQLSRSMRGTQIKCKTLRIQIFLRKPFLEWSK